MLQLLGTGHLSFAGVLTLLFNLSMVVVDLALLRALVRSTPKGSRMLPEVARLLGSALAAILLLAGCGEVYARFATLFGSLFTFLGLFAWGLFLHLPLLALAASIRVRWETPRLSGLLLVAAAGTFAMAYYVFVVEPNRLEVNHHEIVSSKIERPLRLVVIADLQTDDIGQHERDALEAALEAGPDLLLLPGDYLHTKSEARFQALRVELKALMQELDFKAPLGLLAVRGNVDHNEWPSLFADIEGNHCFEESGSIDVAGLHVTALSLADSFNTRLTIPAHPDFHIAFGHGPDFALGEVSADLLIAGHTHGGQVVLPFFGPPVTLSRVPRSWAAGRTELTGGRTLIVSRGVGMERGYAPPLRFNCPPEVVVIDLVPGS